MADADLNINVKTTPKDPFGSIFNSLKDINGEVSNVTSGFKSIGLAIGGVVALAGAFDFILDATRETETLTTQFKRFGVTTEDAAEQLRILGDLPGPSLEELANANRTLLSFGVSLSDSTEQLKILNDVAAGTGSKIDDLSEIFGKVQQDGELTTETFKKLSKQIPGFATDLAAGLDVPVASLKRLADEGAISSDKVNAAFKSMTTEGGRFFGAASDQAGTLNGAFDELGDSITALTASFGGQFSPALAKVVNSTAEFINEILSAKNAVQAVADNAALTRIAKLDEEIGGLTDKMKELKDVATDPNFVVRFIDEIQPGSLDGLNKEIGQIQARIDGLNRARSQILDLASSKGSAKTQEKLDANATAAAQKHADELAEIESKRLKKIADDEEKAAQDRANRIIESQNNIANLENQQFAARDALRKTQADKEILDAQRAAQDAAEAALIAEQERADGITIIRDQEAVARVEQQRASEDLLTQQKLESAVARETQITTALAEANAVRSELLLQFDEAEVIRAQDKERVLTEAQKKGEADRLAIIRKAQKDEFDVEKITQDAKKKFDEQTWTQRAATAQAGLSALASLQRVGSRDAFNIGKAAAIAQALITIPETAIKAYSSLAGIPLVGPALGAAAAAAAVVAGTAQVNQIRAQQFAKGGMVSGTGNKDTVPALMTPGEVVVPTKNFDELKENFARGAIADDQVQLLMQGNAIQAKILDQLTIGTVNEKLTRMVALLDDVRNQLEISNRSSGALEPEILIPEAVRPISAGNQRPRQRERIGINSAL